MIRRLFLALLLLVGGLASAGAQQWAEYRPAGAGYRVEFPGTPRVTSQDMPTGNGSAKLFMAGVQPDPERFFGASHVVYAPGIMNPDPEVALDLARDGGVRNARGTLREERRLSVGGAPARRVIFDSSPYVGVLVIAVKTDRLYQVIVIGRPGVETAADTERFLSSFALDPP